MPMPMVFNLSCLHAHLNKPFAVKLDELLPRMMLLGKWYISMSTENEHRRSARQAVANDYDVIRVMPCGQPPKPAEFAVLHGAMSIALRFTYSLRYESASAMPVSISASDVAKFVYA